MSLWKGTRQPVENARSVLSSTTWFWYRTAWGEGGKCRYISRSDARERVAPKLVLDCWSMKN